MKKKIFTNNDFINTLIHYYKISWHAIYNYTKENGSVLKNIKDIFKLSNERDIELCLTLLSMISIENNRSLIKEFREDCNLNDRKYDMFISDDAINHNKVLLVAALIKNKSFLNTAFMLCAHLKRVVYDKTMNYRYLIGQNGYRNVEIPVEYELDNHNISLDAIRRSIEIFLDVKNKSFPVCLYAIKRYSYLAMQEIIRLGCMESFTKKQAYLLCKTAVKHNGKSLFFVFHEKNKVKFKNPQIIKRLCEIAVESDSSALEYVPEDLQNELWYIELKEKHEKIKEEKKAEIYRKILKEYDVDYSIDHKKKVIDVWDCTKDLSGAKVVLPKYIGRGKSRKYTINYKSGAFNNKGWSALEIRGKTSFENNSIIGNTIVEFIITKKPEIIDDEFLPDTRIIKLLKELGPDEKGRIYYPDNNIDNYPVLERKAV